MNFPVGEYNAVKLPGTGAATVRGQVFMKTIGGDVKHGAGNEVFLNPVTTYSQEWWIRSYQQNELLEQPDPRLQDFMPKTVADGSGRFTFKNVPAGKYYVTSSVVWMVGYARQGGIVSKEITVGAGEEVEVIVTR